MLGQLLADGCFRLGRLCLGLGRSWSGQAYAWFRLTRRLWPSHPQVGPWLDYLAGTRALARGDPEEALELLRSAARGLPQLPGIRARMGIAHTMLGRDDEAIAVLEKTLYDSPPFLLPDIWTSLAWSYLRSGRAAKSLEACRRAEHGGVTSARLQFINRLATGVQVGALAAGELRELLRSVPQGAPLLLEYARLQAAAGRQRLARAALSALPEELQPRSYALLGKASLNSDDLETALWAADQLARFTDEPQAHVHAALLRGEAHIRCGEFAEALGGLRAARAEAPQDGLLREQTGRALLLSGQWEAAVEEMIEALHSGAGSALAAGLAALAALELGDASGARGIFLAQRLGDGLACAFSHTAQARLMVLDNEWDQALALAASALDEIERLPRWAALPTVLDRLGRSLRVGLQAVRDAGLDAQREAAEGLLERLDAAVGTPRAEGPAAPP